MTDMPIEATELVASRPKLSHKLVEDAELVCKAAILAGIAGLVVPDHVFDVSADLAALKLAAGAAGRAALHKLGSLLAKA